MKGMSCLAAVVVLCLLLLVADLAESAMAVVSAVAAVPTLATPFAVAFVELSRSSRLLTSCLFSIQIGSLAL
jgi:hypothetical protein